MVRLAAATIRPFSRRPEGESYDPPTFQFCQQTAGGPNPQGPEPHEHIKVGLLQMCCRRHVLPVGGEKEGKMMQYSIPGLKHLGLTPIKSAPCQLISQFLSICSNKHSNHVNKHCNTVLCTCVIITCSKRPRGHYLRSYHIRAYLDTF